MKYRRNTILNRQPPPARVKVMTTEAGPMRNANEKKNANKKRKRRQRKNGRRKNLANQRRNELKRKR